MRAGVYTVAVRDASSNFLCKPSGHIEFRDDNMLCVFCGFTNFLPWPRSQGLDLYQTATEAFVLKEPDGFTPLRNRRTGGDYYDLRIRIFCVDQAVQPFDRVLAGSFSCCPDFLLPCSMGGIADVIALHDKWIAHHPDRRTFHVHAGHRRTVWIIRG